jgi:hypothetical protein
VNLTNLHILNSWDLYFKDCQFDRIPSQGNHVQIISRKHDNAINWQTLIALITFNVLNVQTLKYFQTQ